MESEIQIVNNSNMKVLDNLKKFTDLLDTIEISIKLKLDQEQSDLKNMFNSIEENETIFRIICENTINN